MKKWMLWISLSVAGVTATAQRVFSPQELKADFTVLRQALEEAHPGLYRYNTREQMQHRFERAERELKRGMTELAFFRLVYPLLAVMGDGHTKFHRQGRPDDHYAFFEEGYFPLRLYFREGRAYVLGGAGLPAGTEIKSINGRKMGHIIDHLFKNILADGAVMSAKYEELNQFFPGYYARFIGPAAQFKTGYKEAAGKKGTIILPAAKAAEVQLPAAAEPAWCLSYPRPNAALLRIAGFQAEGPAYASFLAATFKELKEKGVSALVIDLRNNEGGMDAFGTQLYAYLAPAPFRYYNRFTVAGTGPFSFAEYATFPPELEYLKQFVQKVGEEYLFTRKEGLGEQAPQANAFTGKVYVLQNGRSFSASAEFAAIAKDNQRAYFVGDESGGAFQGNTSGTFIFVRLPNTRLELAVPVLGYYMQLQHPHPAKSGVPADLRVIPTVHDLLQQRDVVLEQTLRLIP